MRISNLILSFAGETKLEIFTNYDLFEAVRQVLRGLFYAKNFYYFLVTEEKKEKF